MKLGACSLAGSGLRDHNNIVWPDLGAAVTKGLPDNTFDPITIRRLRGFTPGYRHPEPRPVATVGTKKDGKIPVRDAAGVLEDAVKVTPLRKPRCAGQRRRRHAPRWHGYFDSRARPLARRRASTRRPPLVAMRARNP